MLDLDAGGAIPSERDRIVAGRRRYAVLYCAGIVLCFGAIEARRYLVPHMGPSRAVDLSVEGATVVGGAICLWALIGFVRILLRVRADPVLRASVHDEHMRSVKLRAAAAAFIALIVTQIVILFAIEAWPQLKALPASLPAEVTLVVGIVVLAGAILLFDRG